MGIKGILSDVMKPTRRYNEDAATPPLVIIRKVDFKIERKPDGDELIFYYSDYAKNRRIGSKQEFDALLKRVCASDSVFVGGPSNPQGTYGSALSLDSKGVLAYVIFKLSDRKWQFASKGSPISIGAKGEAVKAYFNATRVDSSGVRDPQPDQIKDDYKVAYFIVDGRKDTPPYDHPFNLHVDLRFSGGSGRMPIVIDPDIRHPGGSLEPDE